MSSVTEQRRDAEGLEHSDDAKSGVTPVIRPPSWLGELDGDVPPLSSPRAVTEEEVFWSTPPRYSLLVSLAPPALPRPRATWSARLLFATICCAVIALLVLEMRSLTSRAAPSSPLPVFSGSH